MPLSREDAELWAATRVIAMHAPDGSCAQCTPQGCRLYRWAAARLARWEAEHGGRYPVRPPAWQPQEHEEDGVMVTHRQRVPKPTGGGS